MLKVACYSASALGRSCDLSKWSPSASEKRLPAPPDMYDLENIAPADAASRSSTEDTGSTAVPRSPPPHAPSYPPPPPSSELSHTIANTPSHSLPPPRPELLYTDTPSPSHPASPPRSELSYTNTPSRSSAPIAFFKHLKTMRRAGELRKTAIFVPKEQAEAEPAIWAWETQTQTDADGRSIAHSTAPTGRSSLRSNYTNPAYAI
jgi:hypothetical protein